MGAMCTRKAWWAAVSEVAWVGCDWKRLWPKQQHAFWWDYLSLQCCPGQKAQSFTNCSSSGVMRRRSAAKSLFTWQRGNVTEEKTETRFRTLSKEGESPVPFYLHKKLLILNYEIPVNVDYRNQRACRKLGMPVSDGWKAKRKYIWMSWICDESQERANFNQ